MTSTGAALNEMVPPLVRLIDRPGAFLLRVASYGVAALALLGVAHVASGDGAMQWFPLGFAAVLAAPVLVLWVRRRRLQLFTADLAAAPATIPNASGTLVIHDEGAAVRSESLDAYQTAVAENRIRKVHFLPRVEAAQRAAVAAAGGTIHVPYLQDDLRVTIVALLGTLAAIPLSTLASIITAITLLT